MRMITGYRWGITWLRTDNALTDAQRFYLVSQATEMYIIDESKRDVLIDSGEDSLEGRITTKGEWGVIGSLTGQQFDAEVDLSIGGRARLQFLVNEQTGKARQSHEYEN